MIDDFMSLWLGRRRWPELKPGPAIPVRDVSLIDLARHAAMKAPFDLDHMQADTTELYEELKVKADDMGLPPDRRPLDLDFDVLEPFALEWARGRVDERAAQPRS